MGIQLAFVHQIFDVKATAHHQSIYSKDIQSNFQLNVNEHLISHLLVFITNIYN